MSVPDPSTPSGSHAAGSDFGRDLFRQEVLSPKANPWLGKMSLAVPVSFSVYSITAGVLLALIGALLYFGSYTVTETTQALILPASGVSNLASPSNGTITAVHASEGQRVKRGDRVLTIRSESDDANGLYGLNRTNSADNTNNADGANNADGKIEEITAPMDGSLYSLTRTAGERIGAGEALFVIAPDEPLVALASVSPTVKSQVPTGTAVQLQLSGLKKLPKGRVAGRLKTLSVAPLGSLTDERGLASGLSYRATIEIDLSAPGAEFSRDQLLGQTAEVRIPVSRRRLYEWLLDPMRILFDS